MAGVHPSLLDYTIRAMRAKGERPLELRLSDLPRTPTGEVDASPMLRFVMSSDHQALSLPNQGVGTRVILIRLEQVMRTLPRTQVITDRSLVPSYAILGRGAAPRRPSAAVGSNAVRQALQRRV